VTAGDRRSPDFHEYLEGTTEIWDRLAEWWDDAIGDGNATQDLLIEPTTERLLNLRRGERVLDVACGAGRMARRLADAGAHVVAVDRAERFLARARSRSAGYGGRIEYRNVDACDREALLDLGEGAFDAVVCTMALMDMAAITPLISAVPVLLTAPHGRFVFSVTHPVFNSGDTRPTVERVEEGTGVRERYAVSIADYLHARMLPGFGIPGQPEQQRYFHRPVGMLLNACFEHGMVLDAFEEPAFPEPDNQAAAGRSPTSQRSFRHVPWVLVVRLRPAARDR
jgi:SAM-dependent methyltransferase